MTLAATALAAALAVALALPPLRAWLQRAAILDRPNARSLHVQPTPRGGGLVVAVVVLVVQVLAVFAVRADLSAAVLVALGGWLALAGGYALLGWLDDRQPRSAGLRLAVQVLLALGFAAALSPFAPELASTAARIMLAAAVLFAIVWAVNLTNFMDGADGLVAVQGLFTLVGALLLPAVAATPPLALGAAALAGALLGFLAWNRPPARIFLGDVGSYFIGFQLVALALLDAVTGGTPWPWLLLYLPFVVDATLTLLWRFLRGERWWAPHRTHVYQRLVLVGCPVPRLLVAWSLLNLGVCWPLAAWATWQPAATAYALGIGAVVLGLLWVGARRWTATIRSERADIRSP